MYTRSKPIHGNDYDEKDVRHWLIVNEGLDAFMEYLILTQAYDFQRSERSRLLYVVVCPSVCLSSVTFVRPTQGIEIFGNVSTPFGTLTISELPIKILRRSSQGNPSVGELNRRGVAK